MTADGRVLRGARNRQAVVDAFLALVQEGDLRPTAPRVAARAGVSLRSVFHHFDDMESLVAGAAAAHEQQYAPTLRTLATDGPLHDRIDAFVEQRAAIAERVLPVYRSALLAEHSSPLVAGRIAASANASRTEMTRVFARELRARARARVEVLDALTSLDTWMRYRVRQGLSATRAKAALRDALVALLS
jgi:AcrR family transcriptional regulator